MRTPHEPLPIPPNFQLRQLTGMVAAAEAASAAADLDRMASCMAAFWGSLRPARSPKRIPSAAELIDIRKTMREFVRHAGNLIAVRRHEKVREKKLTAIVDCTESAMRPAVAVLIAALLKVDPEVKVLGFDSEVFPLRTAPPSAGPLLRWLKERNQRLRTARLRSMDLGDLEVILRNAFRLAPASAQTHLLIVSDLFVSEQARCSPEALRRIRSILQRYRKVWLLDSWPSGEPFCESSDGAVSANGAGLLHLAGPRREDRDIWFRQAETENVQGLSASQIERIWRLRQTVVCLRAWRFTPMLGKLGFVGTDGATPASNLIYIPNNRAQAVADVFREVLTA